MVSCQYSVINCGSSFLHSCFVVRPLQVHHPKLPGSRSKLRAHTIQQWCKHETTSSTQAEECSTQTLRPAAREHQKSRRLPPATARLFFLSGRPGSRPLTRRPLTFVRVTPRVSRLMHHPQLPSRIARSNAYMLPSPSRPAGSVQASRNSSQSAQSTPPEKSISAQAHPAQPPAAVVRHS